LGKRPQAGKRCYQSQITLNTRQTIGNKCVKQKKNGVQVKLLTNQTPQEKQQSAVQKQVDNCVEEYNQNLLREQIESCELSILFVYF
jgi:hypothetical protein